MYSPEFGSLHLQHNSFYYSFILNIDITIYEKHSMK
uniref:Uncharacterized protein n=1 Tax=Anguilla anguilla TaxID=7936 RepID=A0A0E9Y0U4_ANGAN